MLSAMLFRFIALLALVSAGVWLLRRIGWLPRAGSPRRGYAFTLEFRQGRRTRVEGVVPRAACSALEDVASLTGLTGRVAARPDGALEFSDSVPEGVRQQLLNAWWAGKPE